MTPAVLERVERAILRALDPAPLSGEELAVALQAVPGLLTDAGGWPKLLALLQTAGRVQRLGYGREVRWAVTRPSGRRRRPAAAPASATPMRAA